MRIQWKHPYRFQERMEWNLSHTMMPGVVAMVMMLLAVALTADQGCNSIDISGTSPELSIIMFGIWHCLVLKMSPRLSLICIQACTLNCKFY